jgi:hypothetical protein
MPVSQMFGDAPVKGVLIVVWTVTWDMTGGKLSNTMQNLHEIVRGPSAARSKE